MSRKLSAKNNRQIHREVVTGIVRVIKRVGELKEDGCIDPKEWHHFMPELTRAGCEGLSEEAGGWVFEYIKDGVVNLTREVVDQVNRGDYSLIWAFTNRYLQNFQNLGYSPVEPIPIDV